MRVEEIMSSPVISTLKSATIYHLKDLFKRENINATPIIDKDGKILGIITSSDVAAVHNNSLYIQDILSTKVHICLKNNRIKDAAKTMVKHDIHHLVVMDNGNIVGMVSSMDIIKFFSNH